MGDILDEIDKTCPCDFHLIGKLFIAFPDSLFIIEGHYVTEDVWDKHVIFIYHWKAFWLLLQIPICSL